MARSHGGAGLLRRAVGLAPDLAGLIPLFFRYVPAEDLAGVEPSDVVGVVRSHCELAGERVPGRPLVRVLDPDREMEGRTRRATVVQVVTDDMPYLVDSMVAQLAHCGVTVYRMAYPIVVVRRSVTGHLQDVLADADPTAPSNGELVESWTYLEISRVASAATARQIEQRLVDVLNDVREVVEDSERMCAAARQVADELEADPPVGLTAGEVAEGADFLRWLAGGHFTFLGYRDYELMRPAGEEAPALRAVLASGLGVLRRDSLAARTFTAGPGGAVDQVLSKELLVLTQASARSMVVRPVRPNHVGVKTFDARGEVRGEHRFLGMLTSAALHDNVLDIPVIRRRVLAVIQQAGFPVESYSGQRMLEVLQNYPRAELFATDVDTLHTTVTGVLSLVEPRGLRLFLRRDPYQRFYSCLVYLPRDRLITSVRLRMQSVLLAELGGSRIEYNTRVDDTRLARMHFVVHTDPADPAPAPAPPNVAGIQDRLVDAMCTWTDRLADAIAAGDAATMDQTSALVERFLAGIPESYKEAYHGAEALADLRRLETLAAAGTSGQSDMALHIPAGAEPGELRFKLYLTGQGVTLSRVVPVLQAMGVQVIDERPYQLSRRDGARFWIYDFRLRTDPAVLAVPPDERHRLARRFQDAFAAAWKDQAEVDTFNALVLRAGLTWRQAALLRAYAKYLRQSGTTYSQDYIEDVLLAHTGIARALVELFYAKFAPEPAHRREATARAEVDPAGRADDGRLERVAELRAQIGSSIDAVAGLDADRILRSFLSLLVATLRTNYFRPIAEPEPASGPAEPGLLLAFKLDPQLVPELPRPRPRSEIFVYSPRVEGVHLRFGPVARGGLRWSDRREDLRAETLELARAQIVKNAVIVPAGAKGGFVLKRPPALTGDPAIDQEAQVAEARTGYRAFIGALLDLTDNLVGGRVLPPAGVVRHDSDDPYLVVAAEKGTTTFRDLANEVAVARGFWLGDAFASGGSTGYDRKTMGIAARGAWQCVRRHFRELGIDIQTRDFTVVGIGDMSGDVFGNGMLLSRHMRLIAAFDHRHVFLDPEPDPLRSYQERQRLFRLPQSTWDGYDRTRISPGGGVWPRTSKTVPLSPPVRAALGLPDGVDELALPDLLRAILLAPVDLLWNGGIGTFVKASTESHADVGDKANNAIRVDANQLRVKVIAEGGNLGLTQRGRVEYAQSGGKINIDVIDNSAGLDCSDREVNIKVLLDRLIAGGVLPAEQRGQLLATMTGEVAGLVLASARRRIAGLAADCATAWQDRHLLARVLSSLEASGELDRQVDAVPTEARLRAMERREETLQVPQLAMLAARVKNSLTARLMESGVPRDAVFQHRLTDYFPTMLRERYPEAVVAHPLGSEILAATLANELVDVAGPGFTYRLTDETNATLDDVVRAYEVAATIFDIPGLWETIHGLDAGVDLDVVATMSVEVRKLLVKATEWLLTHRVRPFDAKADLNRYRGILPTLIPEVGGWLQGADAAGASAVRSRLAAAGVSPDLAGRIGAATHSVHLFDVCDIVLGTADEGESGPASPAGPAFTGRLYYALASRLGVDFLVRSLHDRERSGAWRSKVTFLVQYQLYQAVRGITRRIVRDYPTDDPHAAIDGWARHNSYAIGQAQALSSTASLSDATDPSDYFIAAHAFSSLVL